MMTTRHITAAEVRHQQNRVREIKHEREREEKKPEPTVREKEIGIFFMIGFDSATSSFLALLVNKSYRKKQKKAILKKF